MHNDRFIMSKTKDPLLRGIAETTTTNIVVMLSSKEDSIYPNITPCYLPQL
jgi:hypothetical protein